MRICLVYDCLYPHTVGGGERWYRNLADRLVGEGHDVTYLTLRQWDRHRDPGVPGVRVVAVGPRMALYGAKGRRRVLPPVLFGAGVLWHLLVHGRRYDVVHTASFPYFSLLAAGMLRRVGGYRLIVDWFEVWSDSYWEEYLGRLGWIGARVQRRCARLRQRAFCFSRLHAGRLRSLGLRGEVAVLRGLWAGPLGRPEPVSADPLVVFAGRLIPEKQAHLLVAAVLRAAERRPGLQGAVYGDGPHRGAVEAEIERLQAGEIVSAVGFVDADELREALRRSLCLVLPSRREGYGLVIVEAASMGVPTVTVAGPDNAAVEHIEEGINGFVAPSAEPDQLAESIVKVAKAGDTLRASTADWFTAHGQELALESSLRLVTASYEDPSARS